MPASTQVNRAHVHLPEVKEVCACASCAVGAREQEEDPLTDMTEEGIRDVVADIV